MSGWTELAMLASIALAAATQPIAGWGFALVSAPLLVLTNGPVSGVLLANLLSLVTNLIVLAAALASLAAGLVLGHFISRRISADHARSAVLVLAVAGAVGTVVKARLLSCNNDPTST